MQHPLNGGIAGLSEPLAVAVSGGPDSLALAFLLKDTGIFFTALVVNHGIRPDAAKEAAWVKKLLTQHQIKTVILKVSTKPPRAGLMEWARAQRYRLLFSYCKKHRLKTLCIAHHQDDQIETFFLNLERGSGLKGLSGMRAESQQQGIALCRPLLSVPKAELIAYLQARAIPFLQDPTNQNTAFKRNRLRAAFAGVFTENTRLPQRITQAMAHLAEAEQFIEETVEAQYAALVVRAEKSWHVPHTAFQALHPLLQFRVLYQVLVRIAARKTPPRAEAVRALLARLPEARAFTLHGVIGKKKKDVWVLKKE